jgi:hypothetical protein
MRHPKSRRTKLILIVSLLAAIALAPAALGGIVTSPLGLKVPAVFAGLGSCPLGSVQLGIAP